MKIHHRTWIYGLVLLMLLGGALAARADEPGPEATAPENNSALWESDLRIDAQTAMPAGNLDWVWEYAPRYYPAGDVSGHAKGIGNDFLWAVSANHLLTPGWADAGLKLWSPDWSLRASLSDLYHRLGRDGQFPSIINNGVVILITGLTDFTNRASFAIDRRATDLQLRVPLGRSSETSVMAGLWNEQEYGQRLIGASFALHSLNFRTAPINRVTSNLEAGVDTALRLLGSKIYMNLRAAGHTFTESGADLQLTTIPGGVRTNPDWSGSRATFQAAVPWTAKTAGHLAITVARRTNARTGYGLNTSSLYTGIVSRVGRWWTLQGTFQNYTRQTDRNAAYVPPLSTTNNRPNLGLYDYGRSTGILRAVYRGIKRVVVELGFKQEATVRSNTSLYLASIDDTDIRLGKGLFSKYNYFNPANTKRTGWIMGTWNTPEWNVRATYERRVSDVDDFQQANPGHLTRTALDASYTAPSGRWQAYLNYDSQQAHSAQSIYSIQSTNTTIGGNYNFSNTFSGQGYYSDQAYNTTYPFLWGYKTGLVIFQVTPINVVYQNQNHVVGGTLQWEVSPAVTLRAGYDGTDSYSTLPLTSYNQFIGAANVMTELEASNLRINAVSIGGDWSLPGNQSLGLTYTHQRWLDTIDDSGNGSAGVLDLTWKQRW